MEAPLVKVLPNISRIIASPSMKNTGLSVEHLNHHLLYELLAIGIIKSLEQYTIQYSPNIIPDLMLVIFTLRSVPVTNGVFVASMTANRP